MPNGEIEIVFGDGKRRYNIAPLGQLFELEEKCKAGFAVVHKRLISGDYGAADVFETIRLGLIGAGASSTEALIFAERYVIGKYAHARPAAAAILLAAMVGVPGDNELGKKEAPGQTSNPGALSAQGSTATAPPLDSVPAMSTGSPSGSSPPASTAATERTAPKEAPAS